MKNEEIIKLIESLEEPDLLEKIGNELNGKNAFPLSKKEAIKKGKKWFDNQYLTISKILCSNPKVIEFSQGDLTLSDSALLTIEILNLLTDAISGVEPILIAILVVKKGIPRFCQNYWEATAEK